MDDNSDCDNFGDGSDGDRRTFGAAGVRVTAIHRDGRQGGFTLFEIMVTVVTLAIVAAIALPNYLDYITRGKIVAATSGLNDMRVPLEPIMGMLLMLGMPSNASPSVYRRPSPTSTASRGGS
ncbi:MAG TPA: prepilin-type N-terminal cleavage/methylation domain-containing protein [Casimicrobiaceae bacterium]|nr:prepilin-type N-terminal cleavage/methylation domain-containing protein [Casimicrobiaceae bacterium]